MNEIAELIIDSLADDFESFPLIRDQIPLDRSDGEVLNELRNLIETGYVVPFEYEPRLNTFVERAFDLSKVQSYWFGLSAEGKNEQRRIATDERE